MNLEEFRDSLSEVPAPEGLDPALRGLWWAGRNDWNQAHDCVQQAEGTPRCDWVHAHLHRIEGDLANAGYWYRCAGRKPATSPHQQEWTEIACALLKEATAPPA